MAPVPLFRIALWIAVIVTACCEEKPCTYHDKLNHLSADCAYRNLFRVPVGLPSNITTLSLSANKIVALMSYSFVSVMRVTSLWLDHNEISTIQVCSLAPLVQLRNLDLSYNKIVNFPWKDLHNLTALYFLKMNNNEMVSLPKDAFSNLKNLKSLRINNNKFTTIVQGTFSPLSSMSHLQIYNNPFKCSCTLEWLRDWILKVKISVPEQNSITCESPEEMKGRLVAELPTLQCIAPTVKMTSQPDLDSTKVYEGSVFSLNCDTDGHPRPDIKWKILTGNQYFDFSLPSKTDKINDLPADSQSPYSPFMVFQNGTLVIPSVSKEYEGNYSCLATNNMGEAETTINVLVAGTDKNVITSVLDGPEKNVNPWVHWSEPMTTETTVLTTGTNQLHSIPNKSTYITMNSEQDSKHRSVPRKCGKRTGTQYISNHAFNHSTHEIKQYKFDFGVIALEVSETEAKVQLNPLHVPSRKAHLHQSPSQKPETVGEEPLNLYKKVSMDLLYLCLNTGRGNKVVQWSKIEEGINAYLFQGLLPGANYTLCLTYDREDCQVQVVFTTKKKIPSLLIIVSVSIFLLGLATVPLMGAMCCHFLHKYQGKTYKLIMKAQKKDQADNMASEINPTVSCDESEKESSTTELGKEEMETVSVEEEREDIVVTHLFPASRSRTNEEDFEMGSEYSDRLPLGAEAVNITEEINGNYEQQDP